MKIRWLIKKYPNPTFEEVCKYRDEHACGVEAAKKALKKPNEKVLQVLVTMNHPGKGFGDYWVDVPVEEIVVNAK
jgi:hypothetical protein